MAPPPHSAPASEPAAAESTSSIHAPKSLISGIHFALLWLPLLSAMEDLRLRPTLPDTQTATAQEEGAPATPLVSLGRQELPTTATATVPEATTAGRVLASTLAASLPVDHMEVLLSLIIKQGEGRGPRPGHGGPDR